MTAAFLGEMAADPSFRSQAGILMAGTISIQLRCGDSYEKCDRTFRLLSFPPKEEYLVWVYMTPVKLC